MSADLEVLLIRNSLISGLIENRIVPQNCPIEKEKLLTAKCKPKIVMGQESGHRITIKCSGVNSPVCRTCCPLYEASS